MLVAHKGRFRACGFQDNMIYAVITQCTAAASDVVADAADSIVMTSAKLGIAGICEGQCC